MTAGLLSPFRDFNPLSQAIFIFGLVMGFLLLLGIIFCLWRIISRQTSGEDDEEILTQTIMALIAAKDPVGLRHVKNRNLAREVLLDGIEKNDSNAMDCYTSLGFHQQDYDWLINRDWWKRLDALLALDIVLNRFPNDEFRLACLRRIEPLFYHEHPLVATLAVKISFLTLDDNEIGTFFDAMHEDEDFKDNLFLDAFLDSYYQKEDALLRYLQKRPNSAISKILLKTIARLKAESAAIVLAELLNEGLVTKPTNLKSLIKAVTEVKAEGTEETLIGLSKHKDKSVVIAALFALARLKPDKFNQLYFRKLIETPMGKHVEVGEVLAYLGGENA